MLVTTISCDFDYIFSNSEQLNLAQASIKFCQLINNLTFADPKFEFVHFINLKYHLKSIVIQMDKKKMRNDIKITPKVVYNMIMAHIINFG